MRLTTVVLEITNPENNLKKVKGEFLVVAVLSTLSYLKEWLIELQLKEA